MKYFNYLLMPFSLIYSLVTRLRNHMFNIGKRRSHNFEVFTVGVGNLRVGGTGKTPFSEYLLTNFLKKGVNTAYLSRGYGRKTKGFVEVTLDKTAKEVGDESLQIKNKFPKVLVSVCEERMIGIPEILYRDATIQSVVLDDVFQHRNVLPDVQVLLTSYHDLFYEDHVLPMGRLREDRSGAKRADIIVVTKCPEVSDEAQQKIIANIHQYTEIKTPVFFSKVVYDTPILVFGKQKELVKGIVVSALAQNKQFKAHCETRCRVVKSYQYRDHHQFSEDEAKEIVKFASSQNDSCLLTTEKDWQRLKLYKYLFEGEKVTIYVLPIQVEIENEFWTLINHAFEKKYVINEL